MKYRLIEIPDEKIIKRARELGYVKMPTEEWLYHTLSFLECDCIGTRYLWPTARHLYARLSELAAIPQPTSA